MEGGLNAEGLALLRALIFKMWALNEARLSGDCAAMAVEIGYWLPPGMKIAGADVYEALRGSAAQGVTVNVEMLRQKIDAMPTLYSSRLNGDYQAMLNEVAACPGLEGATLADVVEAMALRKAPAPLAVVAGKARMLGVATMER